MMKRHLLLIQCRILAIMQASRVLVSALAVYATAFRPIFPWWWAHVRLLCLLWIAIHIGRRPWPYVYFTVRDILICRRFIPIDSYKWTSPRGPEAKHLRPHRTPMDGVYTAGRLSFTWSLSANVCMCCCRTFFVGNAYASLTCRCSKSCNFYGRNVPCRTAAFTRFRLVLPYGRHIVSFRTVLWPYVEQRSIFNPAFAVRDATAHVPTAPLSPLLLTASATPYCLRSSDPSANFFARPSTRPFPFKLDFDLWEPFFCRPPSRVPFFGRI